MSLLLDWPELTAGIILVIGFAFSLFAKNTAILYAICILMGLVFGRLWYKFKKTMCIPIFVTIMAFFLGFILGSLYSNLRVVALLILAGTITGYWLHKKKIIRTI